MCQLSFQPSHLAPRADTQHGTAKFVIPAVIQAAADIVCIKQFQDLLCLPLQTTMDDKDSGQVVSAVNCYFMCQVGFCMEQHPAAYTSSGRSCVCLCLDGSRMVLSLYLCALCATQNEST